MTLKFPVTAIFINNSKDSLRKSNQINGHELYTSFQNDDYRKNDVPFQGNDFQ